MELLRHGQPRVVVTGIGMVTPLGDKDKTWESLQAGKSGISHIRGLDVSDLPVTIAGQVHDFDASPYIDHKELRRMGRTSQMTVAAATMAVKDANLSVDQIEANGARSSVVIGTALGNYEVGQENIFRFRMERSKRPNPMALMNALPNIPAHYVSRFFRALGPMITPSTACATGTQSIGIAIDLIRGGKSDLAISGGIEAIIQDYIIAGFCAMQALTRNYNDAPEKASRPFEAKRSGFVISEGGAVLILESLSHALKRGAHIYAELLGHGASADAYHVAALEPEGNGALRCMRSALDDAHLNSEDVDYINAHGTSTPLNDLVETKAIKQLLGEQAYNIPVNSTKSMLGHSMSGSGAVEAAVCVLSICNQVLHPTINYENSDPECDLDYVPNEKRIVHGMRHVLSNSFGLGGQNASIVIGAV